MVLNIAMLITLIVVFFLLIAINVYIVVYFQHEEDRNQAYGPKVVVIVGLLLTELSILLLPFDVANARVDGGFPVDVFWLVVYVWMAVWALAVMPFTFFYYEAETPGESRSSQVKSALGWAGGFLVIFFIVLFILYFTMGSAQIPALKLTSPSLPANGTVVPLSSLQQARTLTIADLNVICSAGRCEADPSFTVDFKVSFILYLISLMAVLGMFTFVCFGGIGLAALPMDLINGFRSRQKQMTLEQYTRAKLAIGDKATRLLEAGTKMQDNLKSRPGMRPKTSKEKTKFRQFRAAVFQLDEDFLRIDKLYNKGVPLKIAIIVWPYIQLVMGVLGIVISLMWLIHIFLFLVPKPPLTPFLNSFFIALDDAFSLFGVGAYALFTFYVLWAVMAGNFKFGVRIPFIFEIYPVKVGGTLMNSLIFNVLLVMLASVAVTQFCAMSFSVYTRFTGIDALFNVGVRNLIFWHYFWEYYYWGLIGIAIISLIVLCVKPSDKKATYDEFGLGGSTSLPK